MQGCFTSVHGALWSETGLQREEWESPNITSIDLPSLLTVSVSQTYTGLLIKSTMKTPALRRTDAQFCSVKRCISSSDFNVALLKQHMKPSTFLRLWWASRLYDARACCVWIKVMANFCDGLGREATCTVFQTVPGGMGMDAWTNPSSGKTQVAFYCWAGIWQTWRM